MLNLFTILPTSFHIHTHLPPRMSAGKEAPCRALFCCPLAVRAIGFPLCRKKMPREMICTLDRRTKK